MGASYDEVTILAPRKDQAQRIRSHQDELGWESGHSYSGTLVQKDSFVPIGVLPARVTADKLYTMAQNLQDWEYSTEPHWKTGVVPKASWTGYEKDADGNYREVKHRTHPIPKAYRDNPTMFKLIRNYMEHALGDKWGPGAAVELNKQDTKKMKERMGRQGTQDVAIHYSGLCSS